MSAQQATLFGANAAPPAAGDMERFAAISKCGRYRYALMRAWVPDAKRFAMFVMLNPSTADGMADDPTIRRCIRFARDWGYEGMWVGNLWAWRATDPGALPVGREAIGGETDRWLHRMRAMSELCVIAWGAHDMARTVRTGEVLGLLGDVQALGLTKAGQPRHPLYLRADARPTPFNNEARHPE